MIVETRAVSARTMRIVALLVIFGSLLAGRQAVAFHEETQIDRFSTSNYSSGHASRADGSLIVWNAYGPFDEVSNTTPAFVMGARIDDREPFVIEETPWLPTPPDIDGDIVVWGENDDANAGTIRGEDLATGDVFTIASDEEAVDSVAVSDAWVVWRSHSYSKAKTWIRASRLDQTGETITLAEAVAGSPDLPTGPALGAPHIDAGWIVWAADGSQDNTVYNRLVAVRAGDTTSVVQVNASVSVFIYNYDLADGMLAYPAAFGAGMIGVNILNLETGQTRTISMSILKPHMLSGSHVAIDGHYVFRSFTTRIGGSSGTDYQLLAYDLETGSVFPVVHATCCAVDVEDGVITWLPSCLCGTRAVYATILSDRLPTAPVLDTRLPDPGWVYHPETGHYLQYGFKGFWEGNGGLQAYGYPLTEEFQEQNPDNGGTYSVQYFERQRYEYHPENAGTPYDVLLGRLGAQLLELQGRDWTAFERADPDTPHYAPETSQAIAEEFHAYWSTNGLDFGDDGISYRESLALFGYPISPPMTETNADGDTAMTQYFERAVFEYHPGNPAAYQVLLRRVGAELLDARGWSQDSGS